MEFFLKLLFNQYFNTFFLFDFHQILVYIAVAYPGLLRTSNSNQFTTIIAILFALIAEVPNTSLNDSLKWESRKKTLVKEKLIRVRVSSRSNKAI